MPPKPKQTMPVTPLTPEGSAQMNEMREMAAVMPTFWTEYNAMMSSPMAGESREQRHLRAMAKLRADMPRSYEQMRKEAAARRELEGETYYPNNPVMRKGEKKYLRDPEGLGEKKVPLLPADPNAPKKRPIRMKKKKGAMIDDMYESAMSSGK